MPAKFQDAGLSTPMEHTCITCHGELDQPFVCSICVPNMTLADAPCTADVTAVTAATAVGTEPMPNPLRSPSLHARANQEDARSCSDALDGRILQNDLGEQAVAEQTVAEQTVTEQTVKAVEAASDLQLLAALLGSVEEGEVDPEYVFRWQADDV